MATTSLHASRAVVELGGSDLLFSMHWHLQMQPGMCVTLHLLTPLVPCCLPCLFAAPTQTCCRDKTVVEQWQLLVNATSVVAPTHLKARHFVYPCDTPLIHPYLIQRVSEMMKQSAGVDPRGRPREERKVVLALLRKDSSVRNRDGRK